MESSSPSQNSPFVSFVAETIATGFGSGKWPFIAPASVGTLAALVAYWLLDISVFDGDGDSVWFFALIGIVTAVGIWATDYIDNEGDHDPKRGVIDEWVGVWVTVLFLPVTWPWMITGFFVFRALDIFKPLGVRKIEAWPGGWGIMFDDIAAGVIGAVILNAVRLIFFA
ncbi:MAG: phosphatidylglycerophosphatase A [Chloroflexi bacterium]|nr:phosphatidylglycerophosphatase A [Chloroflexota bacterium]MBT4141831.1 phosphatidylglycerophosphatase A [Chloroflexota bacterium]MBT4341789.1 phosphatidylglycerophosphatase A [Chloroflexota bacterium]MBT5477234.1 phosphatidylglycerophosphatase A [Chloroflexota bacterium]MBT5893897.1 phosphatidylglycerophosphatase A [Chloroflexota bacterium]